MYLKCGLIFWSVRIQFLVVSFIGVLANSITFKRKKLRKTYLSTGWKGRTGKRLARGHTRTYYPVRPDQTQSMNILPLSVRDFEIFVSI